MRFALAAIDFHPLGSNSPWPRKIMVHRDITVGDAAVPTSPSAPADQGGPGDSICGRILARGLCVLDRLSSTAEGPVYQAKYPNGVEVALVVLRSEAVGGEHFRQERIARATQIQHPNVVSVYEVAEMGDGSVYVVLEQPVGEPLSNLLTAGHVFALPEALDLALQAAAGLQAAHRAGFVHGNLSPHTILLTPGAHEQSQVKLFGFTLDPAFRQRGGELPISEGPSAGYASPERLVGHAPEERSDVFSLGAVLHHLLTGMPPHQGGVDISVPKAARAVLEIALTPAPAGRFQTMSELEEALKRLASVAAKPRKAMIHRPLLIGALGAGLALVTGGIWLLPGSKWRATTEQRPILVAGTTDLEGAEPGPPTTLGAPPAPAPARSSAPAPPAARQDAPRTLYSPADSARSPAGASANPAPRATRPQSAPATLADAETDRSIETGMVATPPPEEPPPLPTHPTPAERLVPMEQANQEIERKLSPDLPLAPQSKGRKPDNVLSDDQAVYPLGGPPRPRSTDAPAPAAVEKLDNRQTEESLATAEALGYVGEPAPSSVPNLPPDRTLAPEARQAEAPPPIRTTADPRPRADLERNLDLRQSIKDVMRLGIAEDVAEIRPGVLLVSVTPARMHGPSVMYNLQRLYIAYSAATNYRDEVALELRHGRDLYGLFTRDGLTQVRSE
ncbi:MAG: protein kinase [Gemmatimonadales bacterium]|nr:protein kinase [Gemmatimonadales bacterium]